ncbi:MAG: polysulfide reductase NrfD [Deltaproteobacteria bacterium]|nr:polysulfide reductase NrfD [Deltaproteobacteria bacterium]
MTQARTTVFLGLVVALVVGAVAFAMGIARETERAWGIFLVNFLFWSGISQAGAVFLAVLYVSRAKWAEPLKEIAARMVAFLPLSFFLFLLLYLGRASIFPWIAEPIAEKAAWLNAPFLFVRDGIGLFLLIAASLLLVFTQHGRSPLFSSLFLLLYTLVYSVVGFDLVMSLAPHWYSTLFGAYFFMSSFYLGLAALAVVSVLSRKYLYGAGGIGSSHFHDLGKLLFAFCILTGDFLWSQFAVIWYGNIPEETEYVILRAIEMPWSPVAWGVLIGSFVVPFLVLLSRGVKENPRSLLVIASVILIGMWLERYLLVVPSLLHQETLPLGWMELFITSGFVGAFVMTYLMFERIEGYLPRKLEALR